MKMVLEVKDTGRQYEVDAKCNSLPFLHPSGKLMFFSLIVIAFFYKTNVLVPSAGGLV